MEMGMIMAMELSSVRLDVNAVFKKENQAPPRFPAAGAMVTWSGSRDCTFRPWDHDTAVAKSSGGVGWAWAWAWHWF